MKTVTLLASLSLFAVSCALARAQAPAPGAAVPGGKLPVREVTVFKDGHAYLMREEALAADVRGEVVLEELPVPVMGTFWPYAIGGAKLVQAKAGRERVTSEVEVLDLRQLIEANAGKRATLKDTANDVVAGVLRGVPKRERDGGSQSASFVLIESAEGTRAVQLDQVRWIQIEGEPVKRVAQTEERERLTLRVEGGGPQARVGVVYVQRGLRWIPSYKLDIDGAGKARVQMEAALVNDLIDLADATVNLVIGVPRFEFEGLVDPISLQQEVAAVTAQISGGQSFFNNRLSNSLMTQSAEYDAGGDTQPAAPEVDGGEASEDLFVFTVQHVSLKKGERLVLPMREFELSYRDVYTLNVPFAPPMGMREQLQSERVMELAKQLAAPKAVHVLRLKNTSDAPLTTAPALVLAKGRILAQGRLHYAPVGVETDLEINTAIDIRVETDERETGRTADALTWNRENYGRIDMAGTIELRNEKRSAVELEVTRRVLGQIDTAGDGGPHKQLDLVALWSETRATEWWGWWQWPYWWFRFNGFGEFRWTLRLEPGASATLEAAWHYFWR